MNLRIVTYTPRLHKEFFKVNKKLSLEKLTNPGSANRMSVYPCLSFLKIKPNPFLNVAYLTLSWRRSLSYKNQPIDLLFLDPLKTSENRKVFWCFQVVERANQWTGFYMIWTSVMKELNIFFSLTNFYKAISKWQLALYLSVFVLLFWLITLTLANSLRKPPISSHYL